MHELVTNHEASGSIETQNMKYQPLKVPSIFDNETKTENVRKLPQALPKGRDTGLTNNMAPLKVPTLNEAIGDSEEETDEPTSNGKFTPLKLPKSSF